MKNLELFEISRETIANSYDNVSHVAFTKECVYALKNSYLTVYNRDSGEVLHTFGEPFRSITDLEILTIENILWFGTGDEFVYVNIDNNELHKIPTCEPFTAAVWNPSQDSIAIASSDGEVGVYRVDYEYDLVILIETADLHSIANKEDFINVGWGSINTQFRGTAGKLSSAVQESEEAIVVQNNHYPQISWRGNGEMFVVIFNRFCETKFLVFQYPCTLIHQSVPVVGLQPKIAWSPEGNKIASFVWTKKKCELTIFEKNGLFRSSFELYRKENVKEIKWNPSGNILAIRQEDSEGLTTIDIYYVKNYVWYLKQRLNFQSNTLIQYEFLSLTSVCSLRVTTKFESITYTFKFVVSNSCKSYNDEGLVCASINGNQLCLTNCNEGIKPPPMSDFFATIDVPISFILFHPDKSKLAVVDCNNLVKIFEIENNNVKILDEFQLKYDDDLLIPLKFHHFVWKSDTEILCVVERSDENKCLSSLFVLKMTDEWQFVKEADIEKDVSYIEYIKSSDTLLLQKCNCISQVVGGGITEDGIILPSLVLYRKSIVIDNELYIFSLTSTDKFYVNLEEVLHGEGVISFIIHDGYLLLTTLRHNLMCIRLNKQSILEFSQLKFENVYSRSIEQGSYLLFGIPNTSYVVMQMPRGNIEMCACRMISMDRIESLIQHQKWNVALDLVRIEKLSTNILVDLDVDRFVCDVPEFVKSVQIPSIINDFLLGLQEENVLITLYKNCSIGPSKQVAHKLEIIGNAMIDFMTKHNYFYYISTIIIACFIKNSATSIEDALQHIQNLLHSNSVKVAEEAFKSIYTLKPNARIYQKALEMYDLDLAVFVAKHIQMDPKEYKPFISNLKNLTPIRCRFEINTSLKRYDIAVKYLIRYSEDKNEILGYIKEHSVYKSAYECLDLNSSLLNDVTKIYAEELSKQRLYDEAATLYERAGLNKLALEEYKKALLWEQAIVIMKREEVHITEYNEHLYEIINNLKKQGRILEACEIYEKYLDDYETSVVLLAGNKLFSQALNLVKKYKRKDIYQSDIALALKEYCSDLSSKFQSMHETFMKYKERLSIVRSKKVEKLASAMHYDNRLNFNSQQPNYEDDICSIADTVASTTSTRSTSSRSSTMSSRHRRKEERKKEDLREGGFYEDIALMKALHQLIQEAFQLGPQIRQLCLSIISYGQNVTIDIKGMHNLLLKLQDDMKFGIKEIWPLNINNVKAIEDQNAPIIYANVDVLDVKYRSPPEGLNTSWKLALI